MMTAPVANFGASTLETFLKHAILGTHAAKLKRIFSTVQSEEQFGFETTEPFCGRHFTIITECMSKLEMPSAK